MSTEVNRETPIEFSLVRPSESERCMNTRIGFQRAALLAGERRFSCFAEGIDQQSPRTSGDCLQLRELQWVACPGILIGLNLLCPFEKRIWLEVFEFKLAEFLENGFFG